MLETLLTTSRTVLVLTRYLPSLLEMLETLLATSRTVLVLTTGLPSLLEILEPFSLPLEQSSVRDLQTFLNFPLEMLEDFKSHLAQS